MNRYATLLEEARVPSDPYSIRLLTLPEGRRKSFLYRQLTRRLFYPLKVRTTGNCAIAHILDHSWADLLTAVPSGVKTVVTVHDLIPLRFPGELTPAQQARFRKWVSSVRKADAVIAVSEYTKKEVVALLGIDPSKITVVPNGVEIPRISSPLFATQTKDFIIGSIGSTLERKNLSLLPEALSLLASRHGGQVKLLRVGAKLPRELANAIGESIGTGNLTELGKIPNEELPDFYRKVHCVVVPSLYEGFGLPVLEAMASKLPVVCSNSSSLPEVGGDIPIYFDPNSPEQLATALHEIASQGMKPDRLERGFGKARSMSWHKTLEGFYEVYHSLLD